MTNQYESDRGDCEPVKPGEEKLLSEARPSGEDRLLKKQEIADFFRVTSRTVDGWMQAGIVPYIKIRRSVRFRLPDVIARLKERHQVG